MGKKKDKVKEIVEKPVEKKEEVMKEKKYKVKEGKATTSLRGILGAGEIVVPEDFSGGDLTFNQLVAKIGTDDAIIEEG